MRARRALDPGIPQRRPTRVQVVGPRRVKGLRTGEQGELLLTADQAEALVTSGHIELLPPEEPPPAPLLPPPGTEEEPPGQEEDPPLQPAAKKTRKPRQSAGLSHAQDPATEADQKKE